MLLWQYEKRNIYFDSGNSLIEPIKFGDSLPKTLKRETIKWYRGGIASSIVFMPTTLKVALIHIFAEQESNELPFSFTQLEELVYVY